MIARLRGIVDDIGLDGMLIDVGGVGYLVQVSSRTRQALPIGEAASLLIETHMREDAVTLFGFLDADERDWFRILNTVQGVGGKVALNILSILPPAQLVLAIVAQDRAQLSRAEGVGPRLAARLATELKDKAALSRLTPSVLSPKASAADAEPVAAEERKTGARRGAGKSAAAAPIPSQKPARIEEAISALVNLGYRRAEAMVAVMAVARDADDDVALAELIRAGLKELAA
ncbi:MAG TPA: Holliday junction branch migration protein RuvA [Stellaceae bacterium]|jgi:Holliday junction DNA helicase RuvA|nr:Holliday junction branch migration protein RuvA [Stellaceae bacterium]